MEKLADEQLKMLKEKHENYKYLDEVIALVTALRISEPEVAERSLSHCATGSLASLAMACNVIILKREREDYDCCECSNCKHEDEDEDEDSDNDDDEDDEFVRLNDDINMITELSEKTEKERLRLIKLLNKKFKNKLRNV